VKSARSLMNTLSSGTDRHERAVTFAINALWKRKKDLTYANVKGLKLARSRERGAAHMGRPFGGPVTCGLKFLSEA
jgi:hypothetical protein